MPTKPQIGDGCTIAWYTDRKAATVIAVSPSGRKVTVREDKSTRTDDNGMSECQTYEYSADPDGALHTFYLGKAGYRASGKTLFEGVRGTYHDYSF